MENTDSKKNIPQPEEQPPMYAPVGVAPADTAPDGPADDPAGDGFMLYPPSVWED